MATDPNANLNDFLGKPARPWWRRWLKWIIVGAVVLLAVLLLSRFFFGGAVATQYSTEEAARGNLTVTVSATGKLAPTNQVQVGSELSGLVETVTVDVNDRVVKGQPLAVLDTSQLDDEITQGRAQLNAQQAQVAQAQATVAESRAQLSRLEEVSRLSGGRVPAKVEMEQARAALQRANAALAAANANVVAARAALSSNETRRQKAVIRSPVNGVVLARQIDAGQTVAASFNTPTLFVIAEDLSAMELQVAIDEADVGSVKQGQLASFTVDAFPGKTFPATITRVDLGSNLSAQSTTSSSASSSTTQSQVVSYAATLSVANADQQLRPGMTATAEIITKAKPNVLLVPNAALRFKPGAGGAGASGGQGGIAGALVPRGRRGGGGAATKSATISRGAQQTVYVLGDDGQPQPVQVTTGDTNGTVTEITGGDLKPGMKVITGQLAADGSGGQRRQGGGQRRQGAGGQGGGGGQRGGQ
ncbi:efflux RND transporter periplasmic adaptor subunit [Sphingomonas psychrotolerans]|uniref:Efflux RND transporter periplasmic adaptor subunit n=1 Tax=Sphingomonas psychrotolerans TaxID=1327635 RepID=A0ABU3N445_9SPHN|nr:efflux RND transporter periplasmic adaptor subunit [Sphingomonas psychrotolerans]MDT8759036.1 efflux RND transporter periplasmic adaptor subunit [Sphingomonas psychrotolerans]